MVSFLFFITRPPSYDHRTYQVALILRLQQHINTNMTLWSMASRRARLLGATAPSSLPAAVSLGSTRQFSVAEKDNILPVSFDAAVLLLFGGGDDIFI